MLSRFAVAVTLVLAIAACKEKSDAPAAASAKPRAQRLANGQCPPPGSTCAAGEYEQYNACIEAKCDDANKICFGPEYRAGKFAGACAEQMKCNAGCACDDAACMQKCVPSSDCRACMTYTLLPCVRSSACEAPACAAP